MYILATYLKGLLLGLSTFLFGCLLDHTLDKPTADMMLHHEPYNCVEMYIAAAMNLVLFAPLYFVTINVFVDHDAAISGMQVLQILSTHSLWYYFAHLLMHTSDRFKPLHRFHHRYKAYITPTVGNAVTMGEMCFAYLTPFVLHCALFAPALNSVIGAIALISIENLLIHSTTLSRCSFPLSPILVSPGMHCSHHRMYLKHFAAPFFNIDGLFEIPCCQNLFR